MDIKKLTEAELNRALNDSENLTTILRTELKDRVKAKNPELFLLSEKLIREALNEPSATSKIFVKTEVKT